MRSSGGSRTVESAGTPTAADVLIVGAGPAGLAAAATALIGGLTVVLLDSGAALGGQYWRHPPPGSGVAGAGRFHHDLATYRALCATLDRYAASGRLVLRLAHDVWAALPDGDSFAAYALDRSGPPGDERSIVFRGNRILLATGAFDRQLPFPGWDLPGVLTAGGVQALLKGAGVTAGSRVVVGGTGPFLLPVATGLARAGAEVLAVCEANDPRRWVGRLPAVTRLPEKGWEAASYAASLIRRRVPLLVRTAIVAAHGSGRVESVTLGRLDLAGSLVPGSTRRLAVDAVGVGWGFVPQLDLPVTLGCRLTGAADGNSVVVVDAAQRTSVPGVLAAGETCGIGGAALALREGQLAAEGVLADLGRPGVLPGGGLRAVRRIVARHRAFAAAMHHAYPVPAGWADWLQADTVVCRCEEVTADTVRRAAAAGARGSRQVKQLTRAGMGWCQGRVCGYAAESLTRRAGDLPGMERPVPAAERLFAAPVTLDALGALTAPHECPHHREGASGGARRVRRDT